MNRTEVLGRLGGLLLLPNTELATTKEVAESNRFNFESAYMGNRNKLLKVFTEPVSVENYLFTKVI